MHKRISLQILRITGFKGDRVILGFMISTYLISMWISNTATTMMMYPIAMSMINVLKSWYPGSASPHYGCNPPEHRLCIQYRRS
ncbi:MAG: SLC13 family permease [Saprospiraceae bacterium]